MTVWIVVRFVIGILLLTFGADVLVRGAVRISRAVGISPLVVGLTVVAFGTSSAELAVSLFAAVRGTGDVAFGNVVGSNICNVFVVLGLSAVITPLAVHRNLVRFDGPVMVGLAFLLAVVGWDGNVGRWDGALLVTCLVVYLVISVRGARREAPSIDVAAGDENQKLPASIGLVVGGLAMLVLGSEWLVEGATIFARALGVSELIIGLTVVSLGTSLPEIAASVAAAFRGQRDMAVGNVVGSNIFNIGCVLGLSSLVAEVPVSPAALSFDVPVMLAASLITIPILYTSYLVDRLEGLILLVYYIGYVTYLFLDSQDHDALPRFSGVMFAFVVPITVVVIVVQAYRSFRRDRSEPVPPEE